MPEATRVADLVKGSGDDKHGCPACPHTTVGVCIQGSPDVNINSLPAVRKDDIGFHAACCGPNMWTADAGSGTVNINGKPAVRKGDATKHCGGTGKINAGSGDVKIGG
jgi:uncharacterized Zn-binding protein involved in type VI secretion